MVKTTYALTVFAAVSMAAPMAPNGNDYTGVEPMRRDGSDTLIGAGTDSALNQLVGQLYSELQKENADAALQKTPKQKAEVAEALKNQKPSILHGLPLIGGLFTGPLKRSVEEELHARSLTGDLSHLPLLGELFGGNQDKNQNSNKPLGDGDAMPGKAARSYPGQNYGQNFGQNAGQNAGQNEGQNEGQNDGENEGQNEGQNDDQNWLQNYAQNYAQNFRRDLTSDLTGELSSLPLIGSLLGGGQKKDATKRDTETKPESLGLLSFVKQLTSGRPETISHRRREVGEESDEGDFDYDAEDSRDHYNGLEGLDAAADAADVDATNAADVDATPAADVDATPAADVDATNAADVDATDAADTSLRMRRDLLDMLKTPQQAEQAQKPGQDAKKAAKSPLKELLDESGLGELVKHKDHGVGILPMNGRRAVAVEPRGGEPIQGSTLPEVLFSGGVLGRLKSIFVPSAPAPAPAPAAADQ